MQRDKRSLETHFTYFDPIEKLRSLNTLSAAIKMFQKFVIQIVTHDLKIEL